MKEASHHIPEGLIQAYVCGTLPHVYSVVVAAHISLCDECRARMETLEILGGALVERLSPIEVSGGLRSRVFEGLDATAPSRLRKQPKANGIYPGPVVAAMGGEPPRWRSLGGGIRQQILNDDPEGSLRLLFIPPGMAVPEHGHRGLEMTLVLQGSYEDCEGRFCPGDVEVAQEDVDHTPVAGPGEPCICLAATDAPLRFTAMLPRLLQPIFRI